MGPGLFSGAFDVSFRECNQPKTHKKTPPTHGAFPFKQPKLRFGQKRAEVDGCIGFATGSCQPVPWRPAGPHGDLNFGNGDHRRWTQKTFHKSAYNHYNVEISRVTITQLRMCRAI